MGVVVTTKRKPGKPIYSFEPVGDRLVIERDAQADAAPGGVIVPSNVQEKPRMGVILAVGPGPRLPNGDRSAMQFKVGERVVLSPYAETVNLEGHEVALAREDDILAILRPG